MGTADKAQQTSTGVSPPREPTPVLEGTCRFAGCREQHRHKVTGVPPDYHWRTLDGTVLPRWSEPSYRRRAEDPRDWWYQINEIAKATGLHRDTVAAWIRAGHLPAFRAPGGKTWLVKGRDLDEFLRATNRVVPQSAPEKE